MGGTDVDIQLLEAAKAGDMEVVKVSHSWLPVGVIRVYQIITPPPLQQTKL